MAKVAVILCDHCGSTIDEDNVGFSFHGNVFKVTGVDAHGEEKSGGIIGNNFISDEEEDRFVLGNISHYCRVCTLELFQ